MKTIVFLLLLIPCAVLSQERITLRGSVSHHETGKPLAGANIFLVGTSWGSVSDENGDFEIARVPPGDYVLTIRFLGFRTVVDSLFVGPSTGSRDYQLVPVVLGGREVVVTATRARERETPAAFSNLSREDIDLRYTVQDIPVLVSELPSTTYYSDGGSGLGYNYLTIRGFDQRRISVMINGIPQNDPEDHNIYWLDFPDFLDNVEDIQVQRGAGNAFYGPPSIGGSLNIVTSRYSPERRVTATVGLGTFATSKISLSVNSGLLRNQYIFYGRISQIKSDGYRQQSWLDFKSYFFGLARFGKRSDFRLQFYGGPIEDHLAYFGIPREMTGDKEIRKTNPIARPDEIENFNQPHLELIHQYEISDGLTLNNTLFGIRGYGFFDYDGSWAPLSYFRLTPAFGFDVAGDPEAAYVDSLLIRAYVDNRQIGWLPQVQWRTPKVQITLGSEFRLHRSLHWGRIQREGLARPVSGLPRQLPLGVSAEYPGASYIGSRRYYQYDGGKDIISPYVQVIYRATENLNLSMAVQAVHQRYLLNEEKFIGTDFTVNYDFINPRLGVNLNLNESTHLFASYSYTSREPRLKNLYDAAEASTPASWGAVVPQFARRGDGSLDFSRPLVTPEHLNDFEIGLGHRNDNLAVDLNLFYMDFKDEIVKQGQLDRFGQPITGNADRTRHMGAELSGLVRLTPRFQVTGNATLSQNQLRRYHIFAGDGSVLDLSGNPIAGFPDFLANLRLTYRADLWDMSLALQHVGRQYTDNFKQEANSVDAHTVINAMAGIRLGTVSRVKGVTVQIHARNLLNALYIGHGEGGSFFPAAERQVFINTRVEI